MRFTVLGPVRAWRGDAELELGPPKQRALLALLLTQTGHPVSVHEILDILWGQDPPDSAINAVHRYIGALRRLLEPEMPARSSQRLIRGAGGYRLDVEPDALDLLRFRTLRKEAGRLATQGRPGDATEAIAEALALWRGPVASGIAPQVRSHPVFAFVDGEYLSAVKQAADHALEAGPGLTERVLITLRQAAAHNPLDEALQAKLVLVLAATGHQAEALEVYRTACTRLSDDLGMDPGPELRAAQQQVLRQTVHPDPAPPAGDGPAREAGDVPLAATVRPAQLPADLAGFTGRRPELDQLDDLLPEGSEQPPALVISAIGGMAGIGKTTLAVHWAHRVADRFPDGQLYVDLRGFHPSASVMTPAEAIRHFLDAFGVPAHSIPAGLDAQAALYRSLLAGRRVLVVLDNARDTEHVLPLLPGAPGCLAIVTSRGQLYGLVAGGGAHCVTVDLLTDQDAVEFLARRVGADRVEREAHAAAEIVALCGRLPLALAIVGARAAMNPGFSLSAIAAELRESHGSLDAFTGEPPFTDARRVFSPSYQALSPAAARLFRLLALHPGPDCSAAAAAALAGQRVGEVRPLLAELARAQLILETTPGRFSFHELLRAYATEMGREEDSDQESGEAGRRLLDHYLHSVHAADRALGSHRERIALQRAAPHASPQRFADQRSAVGWLDAERAALLAAIKQDATHGSGAHAWQLAVGIELYLDRNGRWREQLAAQTAAATAAQRLGDLRGQAHAHRALGFVLGRLNRSDEAREHLLRALKLFGEIGDVCGQARALRYLAFLANRRGLHAEALEHYRLALELYRPAGPLSGEASVHNELGWTYILLGEHEKALDECRHALAIHQAIDDRNGEAAAWDSLGYAHHHLGQYGAALACFGHALDLYREIHDCYLEADTLAHIGDTHLASGSGGLAGLAWGQALQILEGIGHPDAAQVRDKLRNLKADPAVTPARI
ncbi:SARP family transcriptional regulator [Planotetraspora thailandica]|uniref:SARP family transcriptional regulator n=1 Tax=Planotetraspora thailandica TaxID=487172 RepID=A0A8J3V4K0_9ACTN|nr:BTAD domain-containing putative transcriptional regulator [Planotetraspora thailandica]GII56741.1 SARP family transcriptional regulator [Planotetraspora thailandica]